MNQTTPSIPKVDKMRNPFRYRFRQMPVGTTPGVGNMAFQPFTTLPAQSVQGAGVAYWRPFGVFQGPQVYVQPAQIVDGLNGIQSGDVTVTPLIQDMGSHLGQQIMLGEAAFSATVANPRVAVSG